MTPWLWTSRDQPEDASVLSEVRARAFARETLVPRSVLLHYTNQLGIDWQHLTPRQLAELMASIHVEQGRCFEGIRMDFIRKSLYPVLELHLWQRVARD